MVTTLLEAWIALICAGWCLVYPIVARKARRTPRFDLLHPQEPASWPKLSVIVPACNEADTLEAAVSTLLEQTYPSLEIVLVNDRSTDATGAVVDGIAARDSRVVPVHIQTLPPGWVGKVHAMHVGMGHATGDFVLFTDADVHFAPGTLKKAVALATERDLDHLSLMPDYGAQSWLQGLLTSNFMMGLAVRAASVGPGSKVYVGVGPFNMVRRSAFERSDGFSWLRMEPVDDMGLALLMLRADGKPMFCIATRDISYVWYPSLGAMVRGFEKNVFAFIGRYRLGNVAVRVLANVPFVLTPFFAWTVSSPWLWALAAGAFVIMAASATSIGRHLGRRASSIIFLPLSQLLFLFVVVRAGIVCSRAGGVVWRGTLYPLNDLRAGQRVMA